MKKNGFFWCSCGLFLTDQILKSYVEENLDRTEERKLTEHAVLRRVNNHGICLNALSNQPRLVRLLSGATSGVVTLLQLHSLLTKKGVWTRTALAFLTAGAWSNTFDRFARGYVVDYIGFQCSNEKVAKITYNLGDFLIGAGALMLSAGSVSGSEKEKKAAERFE